MNIGFENQGIGRFIVDVDGCLRTTDAKYLTVDEIIALHGRLASDATLIREDNGDTIPLSRRDRIELREDRVAFFRSCAGSRLFRACGSEDAIAPRWSCAGSTPSPALAA